MGESSRRLVFLFGPTAVGKTELLQRAFASGGRRPVEIISADSMQVYRHMDIGSAKPPAELRALIPHHLIDIRNPNEQFHVGDFVSLAEALAEDIASTGHIPIVAGGTAFYFRNLLYGLPGTPSGDSEARARIHARQAVVGLEGLYLDLVEVDPVSAQRIAPNDRYRIVRALEVFYSSGKPLSSFPMPNTPRSDLEVLVIGLNRPREELSVRIGERVEEMFDLGLCEEVQRLLAMGYLPDDPGFRGIGYREFRDICPPECHRDIEAFIGWIASLDPDAITRLKDAVKLDSRKYAKRQTTFFRALPDVRWLDPDDPEAVGDLVERFWTGR